MRCSGTWETILLSLGAELAAQSFKHSRPQDYVHIADQKHVCCVGLYAVFGTASAWPPEAESWRPQLRRTTAA